MKFFERLIDPYQPSDGPPPRTLVAFGRWALGGAGWPILALVVMSVAAGVSEAAAAWLVGWVVDLAASAADPATFFADNSWNLVLVAGFFLVLRPVLLSFNGGLMSRTMMPSLWTMTVLRLHRHVLGQSMTFFEDDFAGRLSQKETQSSIALGDVIMESIHAVLFGIATVIGALVLLSQTDGRLAWILVAYGSRHIFAWSPSIFRGSGGSAASARMRVPRCRGSWWTA